MAEKIILYGTTWCAGSRRAKQLLDENKIDYRWVDIDIERSARSILEEINHGYQSVPTIVFPDGKTLTEPTMNELAKQLGIEPPPSFF
jgi:mycoredoxin